MNEINPIPEGDLPQVGEPQMCIVIRFATSRRVFCDGRPDNPVALSVEDVKFIGNWSRYKDGLKKAVGCAVMRVVDEFLSWS